ALHRVALGLFDDRRGQPEPDRLVEPPNAADAVGPPRGVVARDDLVLGLLEHDPRVLLGERDRRLERQVPETEVGGPAGEPAGQAPGVEARVGAAADPSATAAGVEFPGPPA